MSAEADRGQLEWERRAGRLAAAAAFAAAAFAVGVFILSGSAASGADDFIERLESLDADPLPHLLGSVSQALSTALIAVVLYYLYRVTKARRDELPQVVKLLALAAPLIVAVVSIVFQLERIDAARDYLAGSEITEAGAEDVLRQGSSDVLPIVGFLANLALAVALILISLNAMRAGIFSRFLGVFGIALGVLSAVPLFGPPFILQLFWLVALGMLFLGRWPGGGRGPAWDRVEAVPWPTAAERMEADRTARVGKAQRLAYGDSGEAGAQSGEGSEPTDDGPEPRPASRKRRRGR